MKVFYDLHIHSALSPCADNDMTPINIIARASVLGIDMLAIADHNSIKNVEVTMNIGKSLGICVIPAMELETQEDIHFLCLFQNFISLKKFYNSIEFTKLKNRPEIFGDQFIFNDDDEIIGIEDRLLLTGAKISEYELQDHIKKFKGIAIPAHVNRETNGIIAILGTIPDNYNIIELSADCTEKELQKYSKDYKLLLNSDSHCLDNLGKFKHNIELESNSISSLFKYLNGDNKG